MLIISLKAIATAIISSCANTSPLDSSSPRTVKANSIKAAFMFSSMEENINAALIELALTVLGLEESSGDVLAQEDMMAVAIAFNEIISIITLPKDS